MVRSSLLRSIICSLLLVTPAWAGPSNVLTWTDNSNNEMNFNIERKTEACTGTLPFFPLGSVGTNVTIYTDSAVTEGMTYCYRVNASNAGGASDYSNTASRTVPFTVPAPPSGLTVTPGP